MGLYEKLHFYERAFRYRYRTERQQLAHLLSLSLEGAVVMDVGCNHGIYSYWLRKAVGPKGKVFGFEPQPELVSETRELFGWLGFSNVSIHETGLSDHEAEVRLERSKVGDGGARLQGAGELGLSANRPEILTVRTTTLDHLTRDWPEAEPLKFVKIDVEGHEDAVLRGALGTLKRYKPSIQIELRVDAPSFQQTIESICSLGYDGWMFLDGRRVSLDLARVSPSKKFGLMGHRDFFFWPRS